MNSAHVAATTGLTPALAVAIGWLGNWPLQGPDDRVSLALASLLMAVIGLAISLFMNSPKEEPKP